jgi:hypothetical protein
MDKSQLAQFKRTFTFGMSVKYDFILKRGYGEEQINSKAYNTMRVEKVWKQKMVPTRAGVVVGWRWLSNGIGNYDSDNGNYYTAIQSIFSIEVKRGMLNKVDLVLPESLAICGSSTWPHQIWLYKMRVHPHKVIPDRVPTMSDKGKAWLSNEMKSVPRDSKGRWK